MEFIRYEGQGQAFSQLDLEVDLENVQQLTVKLFRLLTDSCSGVPWPSTLPTSSARTMKKSSSATSSLQLSSTVQIRCSHCLTLLSCLIMIGRSIANDTEVVDTLLVQVIRQCQKMIRAERASLFLVDLKTSQLYSRLFNITHQDQQSSELKEEFIRYNLKLRHFLFICESNSRNSRLWSVSKSHFHHYDNMTSYHPSLDSSVYLN